MKVLNLCCAKDHRFEGWFGSEGDFQSQLERDLIECPMCGDHAITRLPSAPRLNVSGAREPAAVSETSPGHAGSGAASAGQASPAGPQWPAPVVEQLQAQWMQAVKHAIANTEDVGQRFAEEARRMHYGETEERAIRGQASLEEARSLRDEGIDVLALPVPAALKGPVQ